MEERKGRGCAGRHTGEKLCSCREVVMATSHEKT